MNMSRKIDSTFWDACYRDDLDRARLVIEEEDSHGTCVHKGGGSGRNPLHVACRVNCPRVVQFLLEHGADVNDNSPGKSPLQMAYDKKFLDVVCLLILHGADIHTTDKDGDETLLHFVSCHVETSMFLIDRGVDVNARSKSGATPLHCTDSEIVCEYLCDHGANVNNVDNDGMTPLHVACAWGRKEIVLLLASRGATSSVDARGLNPFHCAAKNGCGLGMIFSLMYGGADPVAISPDGTNPFHLFKRKNRHDEQNWSKVWNWPPITLAWIWAGLSGRAEHDITLATEVLLRASSYYGVKYNLDPLNPNGAVVTPEDLVFTNILCANVPLLPLNHKRGLRIGINCHKPDAIINNYGFPEKPFPIKSMVLVQQWLTRYTGTFPSLKTMCRAAVRNHLGASLLRTTTITGFHNGMVLPKTLVEYVYLYNEALAVFPDEVENIKDYFKTHTFDPSNQSEQSNNS